ncbi:MAG: CPBP family intramembrane glutamic endopeptidase [Candidatus Thorarchaeota archaeon]
MTETSSSRRVGFFLIFLLFGFAIWVFPLTLQSLLLVFYQLFIIGIFFLLSLWSKRDEKMSIYFPVFYAFFMAAVATALAYPFGGGSTVGNKTYNLLISAVLVVGSILVLSRLSGAEFKSIYLQRGNLRQGLAIGWSVFIIFLVTAVPASQLFGAAPVTIDQLIEWAPWLALFIAANGLREELWFRGIFLKNYIPFLGESWSNILQAIVFGAAHFVFPITMLNLNGNLLLFILTGLIGLLCGAVMIKTDSILASILIHAGADIPFLIAVFSLI